MPCEDNSVIEAKIRGIEHGQTTTKGSWSFSPKDVNDLCSSTSGAAAKCKAMISPLRVF